MVLVAVGALAGPIRAEVPLIPRSELPKKASQIVVGKIEAVYSFSTTGDRFKKTYSVAEVSISSVEKGKGLQAGGLVYAKYWNQKWIGGEGPVEPHSVGHHPRPVVGQRARLFLTKKDGRHNILLPNGCEILNSGEEGAKAVSGFVSFQGAPLADATVEFVNAAAKSQSHSTRTDAEGRFSLRLPFGPYFVAIRDTDREGPSVPKKYVRAEMSGLTVEITRGVNEFRFELH
jgi:hypothetical protein